ncbi:MAG: C4-type zinc ribbon domain-containing protein [Saprospiraceae bacterium]|nr:C4-type zinc ribbon domain-containing protein [Saprospiraceae bacterium]
MAKKELSVHDRLMELFKLQKIDSQLDEIQVLKGELPIEVSDLEDEIAGLETRLAKLEESKKEFDTSISQHKATMKESETLIARYAKQLDDVKNNREYEALTKEIELQKLDIQLSEKRIKEADVNIDAKKEVIKEAKDKLKEKNKNLDIKKVELDKIIAKTEKEEAKLVRKTGTHRKTIEERLLKAYDKVRTSYRNGLAVVTVERNSCGGCFNKIPPQMQLEISLEKKVIACEHCGRILIDASVSEEVVA